MRGASSVTRACQNMKYDPDKDATSASQSAGERTKRNGNGTDS